MSSTTRAPATTPGDGEPGSGDRGSRRLVPTAVVVLASGLAIGFLTLLGQKWLHGAWLAVVNSGAVWLLPAFVAGSFMRTDATAALAGAGLLVAAVVGYYAPVPLVVEGAAASSHSVAIWIATSLVGGPVYGLAGRWWRRGRTWRTWVALGLLGGAFLAEGAARLHAGGDGAAGWTMVGVGFALPLLLGHSARERAFGLGATVPVVVLTAVAYAVINWAFLHS